MLGLFFYVSVFAQIGSQVIAFFPVKGPSEIEVEFEKLSGIAIGAPVLAEGQLVGNVSEIQVQTPEVGSGAALADKYRANNPFYTVKVKIAPPHRNLLRQGTIALLLSPISATRSRPETVVELLFPGVNSKLPVLQDGDRIIGFSSYEDFWSADFTKRSQAEILPGRKLS